MLLPRAKESFMNLGKRRGAPKQIHRVGESNVWAGAPFAPVLVQRPLRGANCRQVLTGNSPFLSRETP